ncbi:MAG: FAD-dependent thymidylate synthase, partial [Candidatus Kapaibacterium sp.]
PFEMVEFKFHIKLPIFIARQWIRHRTANVNEYSGRYSIMKDDFYVPDLDQIRPQSENNKQGRSEETFSNEKAKAIQDKLGKVQNELYAEYETLLGEELARELARINLPLSNYTEWYWKIDLHNLFHFLRLRIDSHAQYEIRVYGEALAGIVKEIVPHAWQAFEDYSLNSANFSKPELNAMKKLLEGQKVEDLDLDEIGLSKREFREFQLKLEQINQ